MASDDFDEIFGDLGGDTLQISQISALNIDVKNDFINELNSSQEGRNKNAVTPMSNSAPNRQITSKVLDDSDFLSWLDDGHRALSPLGMFESLDKAAETDNSTTLEKNNSVDRNAPDETKRDFNATKPFIRAPENEKSTESFDRSSKLFDDECEFDRLLNDVPSNYAVSSHHEHGNASSKVKNSSNVQQLVSDDDTAVRIFSDSGMAPKEKRLQMWKVALSEVTSKKEAFSIPLVQATSLDLPNQADLRKDVESVCSNVFASRLHDQLLDACVDTIDSTRLLFIDKAEILVTFLCKYLSVKYVPSLPKMLAPLLVVSGAEPLQYDVLIVATRFAPCLMRQIPSRNGEHSITESWRSFLKWLVLYHYPATASYLDQHYPEWADHGEAIPNSWINSFFESENSDLDALVQVWDCVLLLGFPSQIRAKLRAFPFITICFIVVYLLDTISNTLCSMQKEQLRHCMTQNMLETLSSKSQDLCSGVQNIIESTPAPFSARFLKAIEASFSLATRSEPAESPRATNSLNAMTKPFSFLPMSASGMKNLMTDVPSKLLGMRTVQSLLSKQDDPTGWSQEIYGQLSKVSASASVAICLPATEIIPRVFKNFQSAEANRNGQDKNIRYFIIDCRTTAQRLEGTIPTAYYIDPDAVTDQRVLEQTLATLQPVQKSMHFCVLGQGFSHVAAEIVSQNKSGDEKNASFKAARDKQSVLPFDLNEEFFEQYALDATRVHAAVLFLTEKGFPYVSVLEGGYAAVHAFLYHSQELTVADLVDHDATQCSLCHLARIIPPNSKESEEGMKGGTSKDYSTEAMHHGENSAPPIAPSRNTKTHTSPGNSYFSAITDSFKPGGKTSLPFDGKGWFKSTASEGNVFDGSQSDFKQSKSHAVPGIGNLSSWKTSISQIGSEMLRMPNQNNSSGKRPSMKMPFSFINPILSPPAPSSDNSSIRDMAGNTNKPSPKAQEDTFTIEDDDDEDFGEQFVGGNDSRTSSASSSISSRNGSFGSEHVLANLHTIERGKISQVEKGWRVSRTQMIPLLECQFFSGYKKKLTACPLSPTINTATTQTGARTSMVLRHLVVFENHIIVLKSERSMEDVYQVKSCHSLAHIARMTCLKKNALMVTIYYKCKHAISGQIQEKKNSYEIQQRDEFIKVIRFAMDKMA
uniref:TBC1 domain family member 23 n=1 Tax=Albugo laibachii Nc14 TaxID=890382 RepID=F0WHM1_9STRA|nr:conserved hypothetical protein [Albugo laibachii Nc14]|eukprot:CCA20764.1 conserved hypothetical protein [Albugo laibachii Nc14]